MVVLASGQVARLLGSTSISYSMFIVPALIYLGLCRPASKTPEEPCTLYRIATFIAPIGIIVMVVSLVLTFMN